MNQRKKVVVPTSSEVSAYESSESVMQIASLLNADVHVLHVNSEVNSYIDLSNAFELFQLACEENGVRVKSVSVSGDIVSEIVRYAECINANLILMGASKGDNIEDWISHQVFGKTKIPVLVMPNNLPVAFSIHDDLDYGNAPNHKRKSWSISKLFQAWRT